MSYREEREFNANIGDKSIGTAGPDAIERDLDNLYANKTWNDKVLTLDNNIPYIPTLLYHPATKEYTDNRASNVFIENNNISIMQTDIISADTAQLVNAWVSNLFVEVLNTNFEDYLTGTRVDNAYQIGNTKLERNYVKSEKEGIKWYQQTLSLTPADFVITNGEDEQQIYYTSVRGAYAYTFFTIQDPVALAGDWQPKIKYKPYKIIKGDNGLYYYTDPTYSDDGYENWEDALPHLTLTTTSQHKVKVKTIVTELNKMSIEFKDIELTEGNITKEVLMTMGVGDGVIPDVSAIVKILKNTKGLKINYSTSNTGLERTINIDNDGIHNVIEEYKTNANMRNIIITSSEPTTSMGNVNDVIFKLKS